MHFTNALWIHEWNPVKILFAVIKILMIKAATLHMLCQFSCHWMCKLLLIGSLYSKIGRNDFTRLWLCAHKTFAKCTPGSRRIHIQYMLKLCVWHFVVFGCGLITVSFIQFYPSELLQWHWDNHRFVTIPAKERIRVNWSYKFIETRQHSHSKTGKGWTCKYIFICPHNNSTLQKVNTLRPSGAI